MPSTALTTWAWKLGPSTPSSWRAPVANDFHIGSFSAWSSSMGMYELAWRSHSARPSTISDFSPVISANGSAVCTARRRGLL